MTDAELIELSARWGNLSNSEVLEVAPMMGNFSTDEIVAFCAGFRRCAQALEELALVRKLPGN